ncbi:MAG: SRPBCC domain-containing protein, partial [Candidatus Zixiibacteriota bacterium]
MTEQAHDFVDVKDQSDRILRKEIVVPATLEQVWNAWTTTGGVKTFFSSDAKVELAVGGPFEIY